MTSLEFIEKLKDDYGLDGKMAAKRMLAQIEQDVDERLNKVNVWLKADNAIYAPEYKSYVFLRLELLDQKHSLATYKKELEK